MAPSADSSPKVQSMSRQRTDKSRPSSYNQNQVSFDPVNINELQVKDQV